MATETLTLTVDADRLRSFRSYAEGKGKTPEELIEIWMSEIDKGERARKVSVFEAAVQAAQHYGGGVIPPREERYERHD